MMTGAINAVGSGSTNSALSGINRASQVDAVEKVNRRDADTERTDHVREQRVAESPRMAKEPGLGKLVDVYA